MDRFLEEKVLRLPWLIAAGIPVAAVAAHGTVEHLSTPTLTVDASRVTTGQLEELVAAGGQQVEAGDPIPRPSNATPQRSSIDTETRPVENLELYPVTVDEIHAEIADDTFLVDARFGDAVPQQPRRGQSPTVETTFGAPSESATVPRGGCTKGGGYAYVISPDRRSATRAPVRSGRHDPRYGDVRQGLRPGDWIITSSRDTLDDPERIELREAAWLATDAAAECFEKDRRTC